MRPVDHSECHYDDCVHKRDEVLVLQKKRDEEKEQAYYEAKRAQNFRAAKFHNESDPMPLQELRNTVGDALRLAAHKNEQYQDAWRKQGYMGNLARILSKTARLEAMLWNDPEDEVGREEAVEAVEPIRETLLDIINLAGFMAVNYAECNRWGKRDQR
jgi:hypothetical protein